MGVLLYSIRGRQTEPVGTDASGVLKKLSGSISARQRRAYRSLRFDPVILIGSLPQNHPKEINMHINFARADRRFGSRPILNIGEWLLNGMVWQDEGFFRCGLPEPGIHFL